MLRFLSLGVFVCGTHHQSRADEDSCPAALSGLANMTLRRDLQDSDSHGKLPNDSPELLSDGH